MSHLVVCLLCLARSLKGARLHFSPLYAMRGQSLNAGGVSIARASSYSHTSLSIRSQIVLRRSSRDGKLVMSVRGYPAHSEAAIKAINNITRIEVFEKPSLLDLKAAANFLGCNFHMENSDDLQSFAIQDPLHMMMILDFEQRSAVNMFFETSLKAAVDSDRPFALILVRDGNDIIGEVWLYCARNTSRTGTACLQGNEHNLDVFCEAGEDKLVACIENLIVRKDKRGFGLAREMMLAVEKQVAIWGLSAVHLRVEAKNIPARTLYESMGYNVMFVDQEGSVIVPSLFYKNETSVLLHMKKDIQKDSSSTSRSDMM